MKILRAVVSLFLAVILLANAAVLADGVSSWAEDDVAEAVELEIVPSYLQENYKQNITREEFANVGLYYLALQYNISINDLMDYYQIDNPRRYDENHAIISFFSDTDNLKAEIAYLAGIVNGRGNGIFDPDSEITREEAAQMLYNTYLVYSAEAEEIDSTSVLDKLVDRSSVSSWAEEAIAFVVKYDIMKGISENEFSPKSHYTREQCYTTFLRMYKNAPCSRLKGNAKNLMTYEEMAEDITSQYSYIVKYTCETESCMVIYGCFTAARIAANNFWILYKDGGRTEIHLQFFNPDYLYLDSFALSEDGALLYCKQTDCDKHYKIDLAGATVEVITAAEYEGAVYMAD